MIISNTDPRIAVPAFKLNRLRLGALGLWLTMACSAQPQSAPEASAEPSATPPENPAMSDPPPAPPAKHELVVQDQDFWSDPIAAAQAAKDQLAQDNFLGLKIDAPHRINLAEHPAIPVIGLHRRTLREDQSVDLQQGAMVAVIDLESEHIVVDTALRSGKRVAKGGGGKMPSSKGSAPTHKTGRPPTKKGEPPGSASLVDPGEGTVANMFEFNVRERLDVTWTPGRYAAVVILGQRISNVVQFELTGTGHQAGGIPARERITAPSGTAATMPPAPSVPGIVLSGPAAATPASGALLYGVVRRRAKAPAQVHIIATSDKVSGPFVVSLDVPMQEDASGGGIGSFRLDLGNTPGLPTRPDVWAYHALSGEATATVEVTLSPP